TCEADDPCQGPGFCSTGTCDGGVCTYPLDCCELDADCDDGLQVTTDRCSAHICVHDFGEETPCVTDANCSPQGPCTVGICLTDVGVCSWSATGLDDGTCCGQDVDCAPSGECVVSSCEAMTCVESPTSGTAPFWSATWPEGTLEGWVASGDGKDAKWQTTDVQAISSPYSLYYGRLPELDYDVGVTSGSVISPVITPPAGASGLTLRFWRSANIEPLVSSDKLHLELVTEGEESPVLWDKNDDGGPGLGWKEEVVDLQGLVSGPFQLRFVFDSVDDVNNSGMGVLVDDLEVLQDCAGNTP
ncbi:MAG: hypothetical protein VX938_12875, partial [Myxococcota bacterium]|nr:hypothetical protein [Myxococcota bacterium]